MQSYEEWALEVIGEICRCDRIDAALKIEEIKCVIRRDGHYPDSFDNGDSPEDTWQGELEAIASSQ